MDNYYEPLGGGVFRSRASTAGPWSPDHQHAGPPTALLAGEIVRTVASGHRLGSVRADVLHPIPVAELEVHVDVVRPGKRVQLADAVARAEGRDVLRVRTWLMLPTPEDLPPAPEQPSAQPVYAPQPQDIEMFGAHMDGYMRSVDWSVERGDTNQPGPARVWVRPRTRLLEDEPLTGWQRILIAADSGSGVAMAYRPDQRPGMNCDLHVALHRDPVSDWVVLDARTDTAAGAGAVTTADLADANGPVGVSTQTLFLQSL